jgi:hypothetical protein
MGAFQTRPDLPFPKAPPSEVVSVHWEINPS